MIIFNEILFFINDFNINLKIFNLILQILNLIISNFLILLHYAFNDYHIYILCRLFDDNFNK